MDCNYLYEQGKMPIGFYNQLNGKSIQENYRTTRNEILKNYVLIDTENIKTVVSGVVETALNDILSGFKLRWFAFSLGYAHKCPEMPLKSFLW